MKITQIKLQNFGPFYGEHELDFFDNQNGVYVIHGDTGQGKTSLLKSISWGFYGKALDRNGNEIPPTSLLNWTALKEDSLSFSVTITFYHENKKWVLTRRMSANQHTDNKYNQNETCFLISADEPIANTPEKVRLEIERIIPLDVSRFFFFDGEMLVKYEELRPKQSFNENYERVNRTHLRNTIFKDSSRRP